MNNYQGNTDIKAVDLSRIIIFHDFFSCIYKEGQYETISF
jgi:hypothetical protein